MSNRKFETVAIASKFWKQAIKVCQCCITVIKSSRFLWDSPKMRVCSLVLMRALVPYTSSVLSIELHVEQTLSSTLLVFLYLSGSRLGYCSNFHLNQIAGTIQSKFVFYFPLFLVNSNIYPRTTTLIYSNNSLLSRPPILRHFRLDHHSLN